MLAGTSAAVPAGPSGSPMSPAESTSAASEPSAVPSCPPNSAPPSEATMEVIGPSWLRISSGTSSPMAPTIRSATGSQSLRQTSRVWSSHSLRVQAAVACTPEGSADSGSSHRSARRRASSAAARSAGPTAGSPGQVRLRDLAGQVPVDRAASLAGEELLQLAEELLYLVRVVGIGRATWHSEPERDV